LPNIFTAEGPCFPRLVMKAKIGLIAESYKVKEKDLEGLPERNDLFRWELI